MLTTHTSVGSILAQCAEEELQEGHLTKHERSQKRKRRPGQCPSAYFTFTLLVTFNSVSLSCPVYYDIAY